MCAAARRAPGREGRHGPREGRAELPPDTRGRAAQRLRVLRRWPGGALHLPIGATDSPREPESPVRQRTVGQCAN